MGGCQTSFVRMTVNYNYSHYVTLTAATTTTWIFN